ncbi:hypothetical protein LINPERPRIM_LOCUS21642 [Linum perenne]
MGEMGCRDP